MLPFRYIDVIGGSVLQNSQASSININTRPADPLFQMPEGLMKAEPSQPSPPVTKLAEDTYALLGGYNSIFVVFNEYVLVLEGGGNSRATQAAIAEIKKLAPGKPIRYVVATHFHFDHIGGIRSYIAEGSTIVTTPSAKPVIEKSAAAVHSMRPDALTRNPKPPVIETISKKRVFDDGAHTVELYDIGPNPHCNEIIIAYLPKQKILLEADLLDLDIPEGVIPVAGDDTADLAEKIKQLGLDVERIIPVHGRPGSFSELQKALAKRDATRSTRVR
jgi:glyoxylase-like metal-dependent hydrolase (beta-lactamase superfamily II)